MENIVEGLFKYGGYWRATEQMERAIETFGVTRKKEALRAQIKVTDKLLGVQMEEEKLMVSKASLDEYKEYMSQFMLE